MNKLKLIKTIVVVLTFLLVFGSLMALTAIYRQIKSSKQPEPTGISALNEPQGSRINSMLEYKCYLYILVNDGGDSDRFVVFDTQKGQPVSKIKLN